KTGGRVQVDDVATITLSDLRVNGIETVTEKLMSLQDGCYCVVDAIDEHDLEVLVLSILHAEQKGKIFLYRSAASFAALRAGITLRPLLTSAELLTNRVGGGLVVVGSYVPKSSQQLEHLLKHTNHYRVEVQVSKLLDNTTQKAEIQRIVESSLPLLKAGATVIIYTSRNLVTGDTAARSLDIGNRVSESLVTITESLCPHTRFLVAKGGITSSDLATKALAVKQARVLGQILPGIPVWELGTDATAPDMVYVVFPGNVGDVDTLTQAVEKLATAVETEGLV
ncbi:MAG: nucleotide-binding domain containing protein, partial [Chloroflexota bacterium]